MPELPDVAGFQQHFDATAIGRRVRHTTSRDSTIVESLSPGALARKVTGHRLCGSRRHGKHLAVALDEDSAATEQLVFHFGMTGRFCVYHAPSDEPRHTRLVLELDDGARLAFICQRRFCRIRHVGSLDEFIRRQGLGPDALDPKLDGRWFARQLQRRRGTVKNALMDQQLLAGIGNEYADEILFQLRVHPAVQLESLQKARRARLWRTLRRVMRTAARHGGDVSRLPAGWLSRTRSEGVCPVCGGELEKIRVAGRGTFFCPCCQSRKT